MLKGKSIPINISKINQNQVYTFEITFGPYRITKNTKSVKKRFEPISQ